MNDPIITGNFQASPGDNVEIRCSVSSSTPPAAMSWIKISTGERIDGGVLSKPNVQYGDAGEYVCMANNGIEEKEETVNLEVKGRCTAVLTNVVSVEDYCFGLDFSALSFRYLKVNQMKTPLT